MPVQCDMDRSFPKPKTVSFLLEKVDAITETSYSRAPDVHDVLCYDWKPAERKLGETVKVGQLSRSVADTLKVISVCKHRCLWMETFHFKQVTDCYSLIRRYFYVFRYVYSSFSLHP